MAAVVAHRSVVGGCLSKLDWMFRGTIRDSSSVPNQNRISSIEAACMCRQIDNERVPPGEVRSDSSGRTFFDLDKRRIVLRRIETPKQCIALRYQYFVVYHSQKEEILSRSVPSVT
jgi:hypothetical protein